MERKGFSLVELVIATALTVLIIALSWTVGSFLSRVDVEARADVGISQGRAIHGMEYAFQRLLYSNEVPAVSADHKIITFSGGAIRFDDSAGTLDLNGDVFLKGVSSAYFTKTPGFGEDTGRVEMHIILTSSQGKDYPVRTAVVPRNNMTPHGLIN
ncbi:MAG: hypothetical protein AB1629_00370 [Candidatus Omnitrophota bacterium]